MRKTGKYEKMRKNALMKTYITSVLCLVLCVTMFFGTTMAWFSDTATSSGNQMYVGTLEIALKHATYKEGELGNYAEVTGEHKILDPGIKWEPGYTAVEKFELTENGDLAFSYLMNIDRTFAHGEDVQIAIAKAITVWNYVGENAETYVLPADFDALTAQGWVQVGTLYDVITNHLPVFTGKMDKDAVTKEKTENDTQVDDPGKVYHLIALHMDEAFDGVVAKDETTGEITASVQGKTLDGITISLVATQLPSESDAFNNTYDAGASGFVAVDNAKDLAELLAEGEKVVLAKDLDLGETQITIPAGKAATLDLNGHNLTGEYTGTGHYAMFTVPNDASFTVNGSGNVTVSTSFDENNRSGAIFQNAGELTLNGGTYNVSDATTGKTWIIATIVDNRTSSTACRTKLTINGGDYAVSDNAKNLFRNYPQQGGIATIIVNGGAFHSNGEQETYIWNQEAGSYLGELYFNGGTYDEGVVYEDYNGQSDIHIAPGVTIQPYSGNS